MDFFELPIERQIDLARRVAVAALRHYSLPETAALQLLKHRENSVFQVTNPESGERSVLRVHRTGYQTAASILSELQWMQALGSAGVRTPAVIPARDGTLVVSAQIDELAEPRLCARCHAQVDRWKLPDGFYRQSWDEAALLDGRHPIIAPAWDNWALNDAQRALVLDCREALRRRLNQWGKSRERYGLIHADLMPENLIVAADGIRLIDFDDCGFGWFLYDPASALLYYYGQDFYPDLQAAWAAGYRSVRTLTAEDISELPTFLLLRCFYGLGWLHTRRNSEAAQVFTEPLIFLTTAIGEEFLARR
jgi:Ser/Thr protein kinase RdoA (MazF antagonist)